MPTDAAPTLVSARRHQLLAVIILAAGLRLRGAREDELAVAMHNRLALLPQPALSNTDLATIASSFAGLSPRYATRALDSLLASSPPPLAIAGAGWGQGLLPPGTGFGGHFPIHTGESIASGTPASVDWIAEPWAATGAITALTGRPKIGKTTFALDLVAAYLDGRPFLNYPASTSLHHLPLPVLGEGRGEGLPSPLEGEGPGMRGLHSGQGVRSVLYLTEQQPASFRASLARSALLGNSDLAVLFWHQAMGLDWPRIAALAAGQARARGARLLVIDTLSQWAGLRGDMENQAGDAFAALQPLQQIAAAGVAVVFIQHERKIGGDAADAGRGSSAFAGAVDTLVSFRPPPHADYVGDTRLILALSRFEAVPPALYVQRAGGAYAVVGDSAGFYSQQSRAAVLAAPPGSKETAVTLTAVLSATGLRRSSAIRAIDALLADHQIQRIGAGRRSGPYRYCSADLSLSPI